MSVEKLEEEKEAREKVDSVLASEPSVQPHMLLLLLECTLLCARQVCVQVDVRAAAAAEAVNCWS